VGEDGLVDAPHREDAFLSFGCLAVVAGAVVAVWLKWGSAAAFTSWSALIFAAVALLAAFVAYRSWSNHLHFGASRLVPAASEVRAGDTFVATLEAGPQLAQAREVRFDLVEMHRSGSLGSWGTHVRATEVVAVSSYQVVPGRTLVPVSLPVPADGWASFKRDRVGFSLDNDLFVGKIEIEHAWEVRVSADAGGASYRATFRITIAPLYELPPYTPRPIGIPASDKRSSREVK
jgi:hypothetical protein